VLTKAASESREAWKRTAPPIEIGSAGAPQVDVEPVEQCPVCESSDFLEHTVGFDYELLTCSNPWRVVKCQRCTHLWLHPRPAVSALPVIYPKTYYAYNYKTQINAMAVRGKELLDSLKMRNILRRLSRPPRSYLDVGCGDGRFLRVMERRGVPRSENYGLELDAEVVRPLHEAGYQVFCERVEDCETIRSGSIDLITMFHVIEHVDRPAVVLRKLASWLSPEGVVALETPNVDSIDARLFKNRHWGGYHFPRHWNLFSPPTLHRLLRDAGLTVIATLYQTGHSFWMYSLHHRLRYAKRPRRSLARMFNPFRSLPFLVLFTAFDRIRAALGFRTSAVLVLASRAPASGDQPWPSPDSPA
jgi:SAM-dependent methyltransferase